jgi:hypothetical protein
MYTCGVTLVVPFLLLVQSLFLLVVGHLPKLALQTVDASGGWCPANLLKLLAITCENI